jgi:hypothetical protein
MTTVHLRSAALGLAVIGLGLFGSVAAAPMPKS